MRRDSRVAVASLLLEALLSSVSSLSVTSLAVALLGSSVALSGVLGAVAGDVSDLVALRVVASSQYEILISALSESRTL